MYKVCTNTTKDHLTNEFIISNLQKYNFHLFTDAERFSQLQIINTPYKFIWDISEWYEAYFHWTDKNSEEEVQAFVYNMMNTELRANLEAKGIEVELCIKSNKTIPLLK